MYREQWGYSFMNKDRYIEQLRRIAEAGGKLGLYGGTFDPIHRAHVFVAQTAMNSLGLDTVVFLPTGTPPHKLTVYSPPQIRLEMAQAALKGTPFVINELETWSTSSVYTADTLEKIKARVGSGTELYYIIGADSLMNLVNWRDPQRVAKNAVLVTIYRRGFERDALLAQTKKLEQDYGARIELILCEGMDISSSMIRERVRQAQDISDLVCPEVEEIIKARGLYKNA